MYKEMFLHNIQCLGWSFTHRGTAEKLIAILTITLCFIDRLLQQFRCIGPLKKRLGEAGIKKITGREGACIQKRCW